MTSTTKPTDNSAARKNFRPWIAATAVVVAVLALAAAGWFYDGDGFDEQTLSLSLGTEAASASCPTFDPATLAGMSPAFAGTARTVEDETVVLVVDRWYAGDEAAIVELRAPAGLEALTGGIRFDVGQQYLITATDGTVNYCGYSGPATPELQSAYDTAFRS